MKIIESIDQIKHPNFQMLYQRWDTLRDSGHSIPFDDQINNDFMGPLIHYCKLAIIHDDGTMIYKKVGRALKDLYDEDIEGLPIHDLFNPWIRKHVLKTYEQSIQHKKPAYDRKGISTIVGHIGYEYILFPFSDNNGRVTTLISCVFPLGLSHDEQKKWQEIVEKTPWL